MDRWNELRKEFVEWPLLLSLRFPQLRLLEDQIVRLGENISIPNVEPEIRSGSLLFLNKAAGVPDPNNDVKKPAWARPIYALQRGAEIFCGHLQRDGSRYALLWKDREGTNSVSFYKNDLSDLHMVVGVAVSL
jgi:hypothetical protein